MKPRRGLSDAEAAAWSKVAASVVPMHPHTSPLRPGMPPVQPHNAPPRGVGLGEHFENVCPHHPRGKTPAHTRPVERGLAATLDSHWERRLRAGKLSPEMTIDLHEHSLEAAYNRLLGGIDIARETGARVVLVIAGRERPVPSADRSGQRGAIRAKLIDWLAASRHASAIAAIRNAHRRHNGAGALYVILKKPR